MTSGIVTIHILICIDVGWMTYFTARTTEDIVEVTTLDGEGKVAVDIGLVAATVDAVDGCHTAFDSGVQVTDNLGLVTAGKELLNIFGAVLVVVDSGAHGTAKSALLITTSEELANDTGTDGEVGATVTDTGRLALAVTAAEDAVEAATVDRGFHTVGIGSVATAKDFLNGIVAVVDNNDSALGTLRAFQRILNRLIAGLVATAEDLVDGEVLALAGSGSGGVVNRRGGMLGFPDVNIDIAKRSTRLIVGAVDIVANDHRVALLVHGTNLDIGVAVGGEGGVATHGGFLAAAKDVVGHGAFLNGSRGGAIDTAGDKVGSRTGSDAGQVHSVVGRGLVGAIAATEDTTKAVSHGVVAIKLRGANLHLFTRDVDLSVPPYGTHLAATKHGGTDAGITRDINLCTFRPGQTGPDGVDVAVEEGETSHAAAIDVATDEVRRTIVSVDSLSADSTAGDIDSDMAVGFVVVVNELTVVGIGGGDEMRTHGGQTTAAIDGAQHGATADIDNNITADNTRREHGASESAATAKDVAVHIRLALGTDDSVIADSHHNIAEDMTILAAAEDGAIDDTATDIDHDATHGVPFVEEVARFALTGTEEIAGDRMVLNLGDGTRHA